MLKSFFALEFRCEKRITRTHSTLVDSKAKSNSNECQEQRKKILIFFSAVKFDKRKSIVYKKKNKTTQYALKLKKCEKGRKERKAMIHNKVCVCLCV